MLVTRFTLMEHNYNGALGMYACVSVPMCLHITVELGVCVNIRVWVLVCV